VYCQPYLMNHIMIRTSGFSLIAGNGQITAQYGSALLGHSSFYPVLV
jgi:hypothetical protein